VHNKLAAPTQQIAVISSVNHCFRGHQKISGRKKTSFLLKKRFELIFHRISTLRGDFLSELLPPRSTMLLVKLTLSTASSTQIKSTLLFALVLLFAGKPCCS
jgi:hypothetical protein